MVIEKKEIVFDITPVQTHFFLSDDPERENALNRIMEAFPEWPGSYYERALRLRQSGREADILNAISLLDQAVEFDKDSSFPEFRVEKGYSYLLLKNIYRQESDRSKNTEGNQPIIHKTAHAEREAEKCFLAAVAANPDHFYANSALAFFYFETKRPKDALKHFQAALASCENGDIPDETRAATHANVAACLLSLDPPDRERALEYYDLALKLDENNYKRWADRGMLLFQTGRFREASEHIQQALNLNPPEELVSILKETMLQCQDRE